MHLLQRSAVIARSFVSQIPITDNPYGVAVVSLKLDLRSLRFKKLYLYIYLETIYILFIGQFCKRYCLLVAFDGGLDIVL